MERKKIERIKIINSNQKKAGINKIDSKARITISDKKGWFIIITRQLNRNA